MVREHITEGTWKHLKCNFPDHRYEAFNNFSCGVLGLIEIAKTCDQLGGNVIRTPKNMGMFGPAGIAGKCSGMKMIFKKLRKKHKIILQNATG